MRWYAIKVKTRHEILIAYYIEKNLSRNGVMDRATIIVPTNKVTRITDNLPGFDDECIYPGYIFVACEKMDEEIYYTIRQTPGVYQILKYDIPEKELYNIAEYIQPEELKPEAIHVAISPKIDEEKLQKIKEKFVEVIEIKKRKKRYLSLPGHLLKKLVAMARLSLEDYKKIFLKATKLINFLATSASLVT